MKKLFFTGLISIILPLILFSQGKVNPNYHYVKPHIRNGTYIEGHYRTNPNSTNRDNYSTLGNTNPHTLQPGWISPDNKQIPSYSNPSYKPTINSISSGYSNDLNRYSTPSSGSSAKVSKLSNSSNSIRNSSYDNFNYPTYHTPDLSAGERVIYYANGRDEFNVAAPSKITFQKDLTYFSFDPVNHELKENLGWAQGKLLLDGPYRFYDEKGRLLNIENYRKGLKHGKAITYDDNGSVSLEAEYTLGRLTYQKLTTNDSVTFEVFGELNKAGTRINIYHGGDLFKKIETIGNGVDKHTLYNSITKFKEYEYALLNNDLHGTLRRYNTNSQTLAEVANYKHGLLEGEHRIFDENGTLKELYTYREDKKSGPFKIYQSAGVLLTEGTFLDDYLHGLVRQYDETGALEYTINYSKGQLNGPFMAFYEGKPKVVGSYLGGEKDGLWNYYWKDSSSYYRIQWLNFRNGVRHGNFREIRMDSVLVGTYKNGVLDGDFLAYQPFSLWLLGIPPKDLTENEILCKGSYWNGKKNGHWKLYSRTGIMFAEGKFVNDMKNGEWRNYLDRFEDFRGEILPFAGQIYMIENYLDDKKNGRSEQFAYLLKVPVMCDTSIGTVNPFDTCFQLQFQKIYELAYYKNDDLHGPYEYHNADGNVVKKGEFRNGLRSGHWTETQINTQDSSEIFSYEADYSEGQLDGPFKKYNASTKALLIEGYFTNGHQNGTWKEFFPDGKRVNLITTYSNDKKTSEKKYNYDGDLYVFASYKDGFMTQIEEYDTTQNKLKRRFDIHSFTEGTYTMDCSLFGDTVVNMRLKYFVGYKEPETSPFFFISIYDLISRENGDRVKREGPCTVKLKNGQVLAEGMFHENARVGEWKNYHPEQNILRLSNFEANEKKTERYLEIDSQRPFSGKFRHVTPQNGGYLIIKVKKGLRHGPTLKYDREGKLVQKTLYEAGIKKE